MSGVCNVLTSKTYRSHVDQEGRFRVDVAAVRGGGEVVVVTFWKELPNVGPSCFRVVCTTPNILFAYLPIPSRLDGQIVLLYSCSITFVSSRLLKIHACAINNLHLGTRFELVLVGRLRP